jgi:hypothetical protein
MLNLFSVENCIIGEETKIGREIFPSPVVEELIKNEKEE